MSDGKGLQGVAVADTSLSRVSGDIGELIIRGYQIADLGAHVSYEEAVYLLWYDVLPTLAQLEAFKAKLTANRSIPAELLALLKQLPRTAHPMAVLRSAVSLLALFDAQADDIRLESAREKAVQLVAQFPTLIAAWERIRQGKEVVAPHAGLGHAANFLYMMNGSEPNQDAVKALDAYLVLLIDHDFNASTFSARVTTGTSADVYSAITTAVGTLKGPAHGGANQKAMEQFLAAAATGDVAQWYNDFRDAGNRVMGIGHREYKVEDPRARVLRPLAEKVALTSGNGRWYDIASQIEKLTRQDDYFVSRNLYANVDYYSAVVLYMLNIPVDQFTCVFAISRVAGWTGHVLEQLANNRLIRPQANYTGQTGRQVVPLAERG
jgi:citrate synthase